MESIETRASKIYHRKIAKITTVYHPLYPQLELIEWYIKQNYLRVGQSKRPSEEDIRRYWQPEYQNEIVLLEFQKNITIHGPASQN